MAEERECPTCFQEVEIVYPFADDPDAPYFAEHDDPDGERCPESSELAPAGDL